MPKSKGSDITKASRPVPADPSTLAQKLSEGLAEGIDLVVRQKREHWCDARQTPPSTADVDGIIARYSNLNALVSGGVSLVPGPWGMAAAIPEIVLVIRNQTAMICDIAAAHGKQTMISKELVLGILLSSSGIVGIGLLTIHGGTVVVRRASLRVLQRLILILGGRVTQQLLKSMISKWLPFVGAVAMATWARISTKRLGDHAKDILSRSIEFEGELDADDIVAEPVTGEPHSTRLAELRIRALVNLMKIDRQIRDEELEFVETVIGEAALPTETADGLRAEMSCSDCVSIPYEEFGQHPEESLALLVDMVALAKRDGEFHPAERAYVRQVGGLLGCGDDDLRALLEENQTIGEA